MIKTKDYRNMRMIVMFDLPVDTKAKRRDYTKFRDFLIDDGFIMLQYSVYVRYCRNIQETEKHIARIKNSSPNEGNVRVLTLTENQFEKMELIIGNKRPIEDTVGNEMTIVI